MNKFALFVWIIISFLPMEADILSERISPGTRDYLAIRVEFQQDNTSLTTGDGKFMQNEWVGHDSAYALDALPHDRNYFKSHLIFLNNYWDHASSGLININTDNSNMLPLGEGSYVLSEPMRYYSDPDSLDYRLALLVYESIIMAVNSGDYKNSNDGLIIYHAGAGQDFKIDLDNSPFDIPSFYFDGTYLSEYLPLDKYTDLMTVNCTQGIVLPESQNQLGVNIALNGTEVLLTGMLLGLPTLYDTEFGRSGAGTYGLMDQGSNTGSGLCPIKPSAFERYLLGAVEPIEITSSQELTLLRDEVYKLPISSNEYFLIEFRKNTGIWADSLLWSRDDIEDYLGVLRVMDSLDLIDYTMENGVLTDISDLDIGLPTSGLLIWHITEPDFFGENPNSESAPFLNLIEADGGDDIGKWYGTYDPSVNNGWKWDMWFENNQGYEENNPASYRMQFDDSTHPNTRSNENLPTGINIRNFDFYQDSVVIRLRMYPPAKYNFSNFIIDELSQTAVSHVIREHDSYIAYYDSSVYLFYQSDPNSYELYPIYSQDSAYVKGKTVFYSYGHNLLQITNGTSSSDITFLSCNGIVSGDPVVFRYNQHSHLDHCLDLENISLFDETIYLPPEASSTMQPVFSLHIPSWTFETSSSSDVKVIPFVMNNEFGHIASSTAAVMNDTLIYAADHGFDYAHLSGIPANVPIHTFADEHQFNEIIPLHMNNDGVFEILALTEFNDQTTLSAFTHSGSLLNNFPIFENYQKLRVYYLDGDPQIVAYDPAGKIDVYSVNADLEYSLPAPVNASSLFLEQVQQDTAWMVCDGSIYAIPSDSVYWGYQGKDAAHSNAQFATQTSTPVVSDKLIRNGLIYNYPNPIESERTKFRYFATGAQSATINIYQLSGAYVETLTRNAIDQQWNEITWDVSDYESGVYIAKIDITDGTKTETYFVKPAILK